VPTDTSQVSSWERARDGRHLGARSREVVSYAG
jgi:hypothetical protein